MVSFRVPSRRKAALYANAAGSPESGSGDRAAARELGVYIGVGSGMMSNFDPGFDMQVHLRPTSERETLV
jgi:hypothetical protein